VQGTLTEFLGRASELGFTMVEVSDGTIHLSADVRADVIRRALDVGLSVIGEVGKKDPRQQPSVSAMHARIAGDLALGVSYVTIEARESGKGIGIYDYDGRVDEVQLDELLRGLDQVERIIWEAPQGPQQAYLVNRFGPNVNLGNIQPLEVLALEALRRGLRFETLKPRAAARGMVEVNEDTIARLFAAAASSIGT